MTTPPLPLHEALGVKRPAVLATVGGGGKTTALFALAAEWEAAPVGTAADRTILTTTTKMTIPREGRALPLALTEAELAAVKGQSVVVGSGRGSRARILGMDASWPRQALASGRAGAHGLIAVEADGSKGRPLKAPAAHEPVLPEGAAVVVAVIGASAFGKPLDARSVHRPERAAPLAGVALGAEITPKAAAAVLTHPEGGRKGAGKAQFVILIASAARNEAAARELAGLVDGPAVLWDVAEGLLERVD